MLNTSDILKVIAVLLGTQLGLHKICMWENRQAGLQKILNLARKMSLGKLF